jgi:hypothetical protein
MNKIGEIMGPTMESKANAKTGLDNQQIADSISWNQLTSVNGGKIVKLVNKLRTGIPIIKYYSINKSKPCCRGQGTASDLIASGNFPPPSSSKKVPVLEPSCTHI